MAKLDEQEYIERIGLDGAHSAFNKPYSEDLCGRYFLDLGMIMSLLPKPPGKLLDLGSGTGWTSVFFALRGYDVVGQDISPSMTELAEKNKARYPVTSSLQFITSDYENLQFGEEFNAAVFYDCLHHCEDVRASLAAVARVLKPGGVCITVEPGVGHSKHPESLYAMEKWGVTERDMPPSLIIAEGRRAGFSKAKIYLRLHDSPLETLPDLSLAGLVKVAKTFARFLPVLCSRYANIVVLTK